MIHQCQVSDSCVEARYNDTNYVAIQSLRCSRSAARLAVKILLQEPTLKLVHINTNVYSYVCCTKKDDTTEIALKLSY